jgi:hypothetical protein
MTLFLLLSACTMPSTEMVDDTYTWQGWIYDDLPADGVAGLTSGAVEVRDGDGETLAFGTQPENQEPGTWRIRVANPESVEIRISGPSQMTTVWRTTTPASQAYWFSGSFFAVKLETMGGLWAALSELEGEALGQSDGAHLYGQVLARSSADEAAWTGATITVYDGEGRVHPAITLSTDEQGFFVPSDTEPITAFTATDLAPGPIRLVVDASDGRSLVTDYMAEPGDLLGAFAFTLPES